MSFSSWYSLPRQFFYAMLVAAFLTGLGYHAWEEHGLTVFMLFLLPMVATLFLGFLAHGGQRVLHTQTKEYPQLALFLIGICVVFSFIGPDATAYTLLGYAVNGFAWLMLAYMLFYATLIIWPRRINT